MAPFTEVARRDLLHTYMKYGFEDEDDLDFYIQTFLHVVIPKHQFCVGHTSPFKFICDIYFERVKFALAFGSRGSGKTFDFALINHLKALFKQYPIKLLMSASTLDQTNNGYAYFKQFLEADALLWEQLLGEPIQSRTRFKNGATLQIAAGTMKGLNGPHPNVTTIDEVELMELPVLEQGLSMSISTGMIPAQDILGSTRKRSAGTMNTLLAEKDDRNLAVYTFCLSGETVIRTPNGDSRLRDLVGKEFYVYSVDAEQNLVLRKATNVRKTRPHAEVYEVVYEWWAGPKGGYKRGSIVATPDHRFMLADGSYCELQDLELGDSLMPFAKLKQPIEGKNRGWFVGFTATDKVREHCFVWEQVYGAIPRGSVIHHRDGNDYNNTPSNLECLTRSEHNTHHLVHWHQEAGEAKKRSRSQKLSEARYASNPMNDPEVRHKAATWWDRKSPEEQERLRQLHRENGLRHQRVDNHKVVAVHPHGFEDVYCLEVEDTHNFAANEVFVHNCVWEALEQCTRLCHDDPEWGTCLAWNKCKGKAHECRGWYPISAFIQKTSNLSSAMFSTEWENKSPSGGLPVFAEHFDEQVHVISMLGGGKFKTFYSIFQEKDIPKHWRRIGGMDFGAHFAYLQIALEPQYDIWVVFFEYYHHGDRLLSRHAQEIKRQPYWRSRLPIFSDPSGHQSILEMRGYGLNCLPAMNDLAEGVDEVKARLEINPVNGLPKLLVLDTCTELRREFAIWEHGALPDGKPDLDTYEDGNDHCLDALRYATFTYPRRPKTHVKATTIAGL